MTTRQKTYVVLVLLALVPLFLGFIIGFIVGHSSSKPVQAVTEQQAEDVAEAVSPNPLVQIVDELQQEESAADTTSDEVEEQSTIYVFYRKSMPKFRGKFNDMPEKHLEAIAVTGLKKVPQSRTDVDRTRLVKIESCDLYEVDKLTHSIPYLTKGAARELTNIATRFQEILANNGLPKYKIVVTSVLRTEEDVKKLRKSGNVNASTNSAHCYGSTFDVSYVSFEKADDDPRMMDSYELKKVLVETMLDEKEAGRIYAKYERKQPCFHTTSRI